MLHLKISSYSNYIWELKPQHISERKWRKMVFDHQRQLCKRMSLSWSPRSWTVYGYLTKKKKKKQYHRPHPKTNVTVKNNMFSYCSLKSSFLEFGLILALRLFNVEEKNIYLQFRGNYFQKFLRHLEEILIISCI